MTSDPSVYNSDHHKNWDSYTCDTVMRAFVCKKVKGTNNSNPRDLIDTIIASKIAKLYILRLKL